MEFLTALETAPILGTWKPKVIVIHSSAIYSAHGQEGMNHEMR